MNRLQGCQRLRQEAGIAGTGPVTTINQVGEAKRVVDWWDAAWSDIQRSRKWSFLWESPSVVITAGTYFTAGTIAADRYQKDATYDIYGSPLEYMPWEDFRQAYPVALIAPGLPAFWTIRPDLSFAVNSKPTSNATYTVERYMNPVVLTQDTDTPALPEQHHMAIVYKALMLYANFEEAGITRATAEEEFARHMSQLTALSLPDLIGAPALC